MNKETEILKKAMQEASTKLYEEAAKKYTEEHAKESHEVGENEEVKGSKKKSKKKNNEEAIDAEYEVKDEK